MLLNIVKLSHDGRGIGYLDGVVTFVEQALPGEMVEIAVLKKKANLIEARVVNVVTPSQERVQPRCSVFGVCGGCSLQHMEITAQLHFKEAVFKEQLLHAGLTPACWLPPLQAKTWAYRHKARLGVRYVAKKGSVLVGFRERQGRFIVDMNCCEVLAVVGEKIVALRHLLHDLAAKQHIAQIEVAVFDNTTALIIRHLIALSDEDKKRLIHFGQTEGWAIYLQPGNECSTHLLSGVDGLYYRFEDFDLNLKAGPHDFTQINASLNPLMVKQALQLLELTEKDKVLDFFCGLGNFSLPLARYAKAVIGVEGSARMVEQAKQNALANHLSNVQFYEANLFEPLDHLPFAQEQFTKILLDPPRSGAEALMHQIERFKAEKIVYVSCHAATLIRDAAILVHEQGYRLTVAGILDMFPHTSHFEAMAVFEKTRH